MIEEQKTETIYCTYHPNTESNLRCNRCEKPICARCAILTDTGYRCRDCVRGIQKAFDNALWYDYVFGFATASILSFLGSLIASRLGFFVILLAPIAGGIIAEAIRVVVRRRRARTLYTVVTVGTAIGSLILPLTYILPLLLAILGQGSIGGGFIWGILYPLLYAVIVTSTVYYRFRGIQVR
ncbi:MAG: hypothetical protein EHM41_06750 [Chloroflexi bacterium]|jgi:hypothetical protein|nr:MAG: hypothetical protein EHM41_06750 [Chloroflexota bacterium]